MQPDPFPWHAVAAPGRRTVGAQRFRERRESVQAGFVDKPRETVEEADNLVRDFVQELTAGFVQRRQNFERH